ncbi:hypothetical protein JCM33374_g240 [Metschnikowia sp. JCM 33374]|nr:hypothetical protein JCM33374_g240 [Metschnikowia sp. JCM 33374]
MRPFKISRAIIGTSLSEPVKCSENMQLAINSSNHLTIIEPKLPLLHQCFEPANSEGTSFALDSDACFDVRSVFHIENLESLGFQLFSRILINDKENMFNFSRISEPIIVGHAWSPIEACTRDCYLGVLLNTGEVMVLKRDSLDANNYSLKFRSFTSILDQMSLPQNRLTAEGDLVLTGDQFSELKVTDFSFGKTSHGSLIVCLAHESGDITIHRLTEGLPVLQRLRTEGLVVKMLWSSSNTELYYVLQDNSVWGCKFGSKMSLLESPVKIKDSSRFLISHLKFLPLSKTLIVTDAKSLHMGSMDSPCVSANLPYNTVLVNLSAIENDSTVSVLLPFESGRFSIAKLDISSKTIDIVKESPGWESFYNQTLHKYQVSLTKEQNKASSKPFQPYLADPCEGQLIIHGCVPMFSNGYIAVVYSLTPKNIISHTIKSRREFNVGFLPMSAIISHYEAKANFGTSALAHLSSLILSDSAKIPKINKNIRDGTDDSLRTFVDQLREWKLSKFSNPSSVELSVIPNRCLSDSIIQNFRENLHIEMLQKHFLLNLSIKKTLMAIKSSNPYACDAFDQELVALAHEQDVISSKIRTQLASIVVIWASKQSGSSFSSTVDTFLLNTYRVVLLNSKMAPEELPIPENVKLTISTDLCTEMFEVSKQEVISSQFLKTVTSSSKHNWPRCDLTLLPILDLNNKMDELESHSYLSARRDESYILGIIFECLNYCIYTGTRTFDLKIGV